MSKARKYPKPTGGDENYWLKVRAYHDLIDKFVKKRTKKRDPNNPKIRIDENDNILTNKYELPTMYAVEAFARHIFKLVYPNVGSYEQAIKDFVKNVNHPSEEKYGPNIGSSYHLKLFDKNGNYTMFAIRTFTEELIMYLPKN